MCNGFEKIKIIIFKKNRPVEKRVFEIDSTSLNKRKTETMRSTFVMGIARKRETKKNTAAQLR